MNAKSQTPPRSIPALRGLAALSVALTLGCNDEGPPNPVPVERPLESPVPSAEIPGPQVRSLEWRNPWGGPPGNLMVDGDFEHSIGIEEYASSSMGWVAFTNFGQVGLRAETGGLCRTGVRCGVLTPGTVLFGRGTSASGRGMVASVWVKPPPDADCTLAQVTAIDCNFTGFGSAVGPVSTTPGPDGWCQLKGALFKRESALCLYIETNLTGEQQALIDSVVLMPDDGTVAPRALTLLPVAKRERIAKVARWVRDHTPLGRQEPSRPPMGIK